MQRMVDISKAFRLEHMPTVGVDKDFIFLEHPHLVRIQQISFAVALGQRISLNRLPESERVAAGVLYRFCTDRRNAGQARNIFGGILVVAAQNEDGIAAADDDLRDVLTVQKT